MEGGGSSSRFIKLVLFYDWHLWGSVLCSLYALSSEIQIRMIGLGCLCWTSHITWHLSVKLCDVDVAKQLTIYFLFRTANVRSSTQLRVVFQRVALNVAKTYAQFNSFSWDFSDSYSVREALNSHYLHICSSLPFYNLLRTVIIIMIHFHPSSSRH